MNKRHWILLGCGTLIVLSILGIAFAIAWKLTEPPEVAELPTVVINSPHAGDQVQVDQEVIVQATATDPRGVAHVELWVNGTRYASDTSLSLQGQSPFVFQTSWRPSAAGDYALEVKAYSTRPGEVGEATITVHVVEVTATPTLTAIPTEIATPVSGEPTATWTPVVIITPPPPGEPACTNGSQPLNARTGPGRQYDSQGSLVPGQTVRVIGQNSGWWQIEGGLWVSGGTGYCQGNAAASSVPVVPAPPTPTFTPTSTSTSTSTPTATPTETLWIIRVVGGVKTHEHLPLAGAEVCFCAEEAGECLRWECGLTASEPPDRVGLYEVRYSSSVCQIPTRYRVSAPGWITIEDEMPPFGGDCMQQQITIPMGAITLQPAFTTTDAAFQQFPGGVMFWRKDTGKIYVLYYYYNCIRVWGIYGDSFAEGDPLYSCPRAEANAPYGPVRGFGKLWCDSQKIQQQLGLPSLPEKGYSMRVQENALFDPDGVVYNLSGSTWTSSCALPACTWDGVLYCPPGKNCRGACDLVCVKPNLALGYVLPGWCPVATCSEIEIEWMGTIPPGWSVELQSKHPGQNWITVQTWKVKGSEDRGIFTPLPVGPADIGMELRLRALLSAQMPVRELTVPVGVNIH